MGQRENQELSAPFDFALSSHHSTLNCMTPAETPAVHRAIVVALFALTALLFARAVGNDFVNYDDPDYVTANEHVKAGLGIKGIKWALQSGEASNWHPLTWVSHMIDVSLFGLKPWGHHATSVLLHALNAALAFVAFRKLTGALWTSAFFAALFAWHPLRVESVAWVSERKDVLSGTFWFLTLWSYAAYVGHRQAGADENGKTRGIVGRFYALTLMAFALGLMSKPMLVTLPCVLLLLDVWPLRRIPIDGTFRQNLWPVVREKIPFFILALASSYATYRVQDSGGSVSAALTLGARLENAVVAVARYLGNFFWPADLAVLYPHPGKWPGGIVMASVVLVFGLTAFAWWQRRIRPWVGVGWLWFLGTLVPVVGIVQVGVQSMADRYTYLPMLGVQLAVLWTLREMNLAGSGGVRLLGVGAGAVLIGCGVLTWRQTGVWQNSFTLFDHAIAVTKNNYVAHDNRGLYVAKAGRIDEAMADYRRSLAINPIYLNANNNLGHALAQQGKFAEAIPLYRTALKTNANHVEVRNNLANALSDLGQLPEAMEHYEFILARDPNHVNALNGSAVALAMQNRLPEAKARLEKSLRLAPDNASALSNLGNVCSMLGLRDEAIAHYRRTTVLNPSDPHPHYLIGALLLQQEKFEEAIASLQRAVALRPKQADAYAHLGLAYAKLGRRDEAIRNLTTALQQQPDYPAAKSWLEAVQAMPAVK
jgi:tetratricopeptide (TPR) repeat protein